MHRREFCATAAATLGSLSVATVTRGQSAPISITSAADLQAIRDDLEADYALDSDIDGSAADGLNGGDGFEPIGQGFNAFSGTLDGRGYTIHNLTIDRPGADSAGIFADVDGGTIENLTTEGIDVTGAGGTIEGVAGLAGAFGGTVTNCTVDGTVTGEQNVGGLVGYLTGGTITDSSAAVTADGDERVGGLVGTNTDAVIEESSTSGTVTGEQAVGGLTRAGGLVGQNRATITASQSSATVEGDETLGGLVGLNQGVIDSAAAVGSVDGNSYVGGLVGHHFEGRIEVTSAHGSVTGQDRYVGGLVGENWDRIIQSIAFGFVDGFEQVGGLVGESTGRIEQSYARCEVTGTQEVGGLVGTVYSDSVIEASYAAGVVIADSDVGGLIGREVLNSTVTNAYWDINATGQGTSPAGEGLTTSEMQGEAAADNMDGFDFGGTWAVVTDPAGYPILHWQADEQPDEPPEAAFSIDPATPNVDETVTFTDESSPGSAEIVSYEWDLTGDGSVDATGDGVTWSYESAGGYDVTLTVVDAADESDTVVDTLSVQAEADGPPALPGQDNPPQDIDGDGLYEDINGDGNFLIGDVQLFFQHRDSDAVQNYAESFNFSGNDPSEVTIGDVQGLFLLYTDQN